MRIASKATASLFFLSLIAWQDKSREAPLESWYEKAQAAFKAIHDTTEFPTPHGAVPTAPQKGYEKVDRLVKEAQAAYEPLKKQIDADLQALGAGAESAKKFPQDFLKAMERLQKGDFKEALEWYYSGAGQSAKKDYSRLLFFHAYMNKIMEWNKTAEVKMSASEKQGIQKVNEHRLMLGLAVLELNAKLTAAARMQTEFCASKGMLKHQNDDPKNRSASQRAKNQGYKAFVNENGGMLGGMMIVEGDGKGSSTLVQLFSMWRYDGGHYRNMVEPSHTQVGAAEKGNYGFMVPGFGEDNQFTPIKFPPSGRSPYKK